jgi:hypothetical protein
MLPTNSRAIPNISVIRYSDVIDSIRKVLHW